MSKAKAIKSTWLDRFVVKTKIKTPVGITLSPHETEVLADVEALDVQVLKDNQQQVLAALGATYIKETTKAIKKASGAKSSAASLYDQTKDPIKKREWARRLVVADNTHKSLTDMKNRMDATRERLEMIKGDIELQIIEAEAKVAETRAYAKAGKQLRLAGEKLIDARTRAKHNQIEYTNLEVNMESAERMIDDSEAQDLLERAETILGRREQVNGMQPSDDNATTEDAKT